jgi:hypothetical protein
MRLTTRGSKVVDRLIHWLLGSLVLLAVPWHFLRLRFLLESVAATLEISTHLLIIRDCARDILTHYLPGHAAVGTQVVLLGGIVSLLTMSAIQTFRSSSDKSNPLRAEAAEARPAKAVATGSRIATEGEHFNFILDWGWSCAEGEELRVLVPLRLVQGYLIPAPELYLSELTRIVHARRLSAEYLFLITPELVASIGKRRLRAFLRLYENVPSLRVTYLTQATIDRWCFKRCDHVIALLGEKIGLSHQRDAAGRFFAGRVLTEKRRDLSENVYMNYRIASEKACDFLERI